MDSNRYINLLFRQANYKKKENIQLYREGWNHLAGNGLHFNLVLNNNCPLYVRRARH